MKPLDGSRFRATILEFEAEFDLVFDRVGELHAVLALLIQAPDERTDDRRARFRREDGLTGGEAERHVDADPLARVHDGDAVIPGGKALARLRRRPFELREKEGLALINGTQIMTAIGCLAVHRALLVAKAADVA